LLQLVAQVTRDPSRHNRFTLVVGRAMTRKVKHNGFRVLGPIKAARRYK